MPFLPRSVCNDWPRVVTNDFAPVWRLLDDYANQVVSARTEQSIRQPRAFNPRFDVKEVKGAYELVGELPGVEQSNLEVEFPDHRTIVIKGSTGYAREEGSPAAQAPQQAAVESTPSETSSHQATVEDESEADFEKVDASEAATSVATPITQQVQPAPSTEATQSGRYWVSERYTGQFQRSFAFPEPVDVENVKAKLRNGVLEVTIPKVPKADVKRINID